MRRVARLVPSFCLAALLAVPAVFAQTAPPPAAHPHAHAVAGARPGDDWWKHAVIYEIYPRSLQDTNGDGIGDIHGIEQRLQYLKDLGIDAIWITPMYPSPQVDFGYDIADYEAIDPQYGTMADFDTLMKTAKKLNIRVIMDIVLNHTSDQHPWFLESKSSKTNPKRDWYIWRDGKPGPDGKMGPPNNWQSWFGHSAWTPDPATGQYYYHYFYTQQPDLNWRNPAVRKAMYGVIKFWLDKGVSGFRMDAVSRLFEDEGLRDDPYLPGINAFGDRNIQHKYTDDLPEVHDVFREIRAIVNKYPQHPVLIAEADEPNIEALSKLYGAHDDEIQLPMDFQIADVNQLSAPKFRRLLNEAENNPAHGWTEYFFSNHDQPRSWDRYGDGNPADNDQIAKLMAVLLLGTRATPQMYYGEEIGMRTTEPTRKEDVRDPEGITGWPKEKGRDGERTPMQWTPARPNAGFTTPQATPWLPIPMSSVTVNVETESSQKDSIYAFYRRMLALRHTDDALVNGDQRPLLPDDANVLAFSRNTPRHSVTIAMNMSGAEHTVTLPGGPAQVLLSNYMAEGEKVQPGHLTIVPYGVVLLEAAK